MTCASSLPARDRPTPSSGQTLVRRPRLLLGHPFRETSVMDAVFDRRLCRTRRGRSARHRSRRQGRDPPPNSPWLRLGQRTPLPSYGVPHQGPCRPGVPRLDTSMSARSSAPPRRISRMVIWRRWCGRRCRFRRGWGGCRRTPMCYRRLSRWPERSDRRRCWPPGSRTGLTPHRSC